MGFYNYIVTNPGCRYITSLNETDSVEVPCIQTEIYRFQFDFQMNKLVQTLGMMFHLASQSVKLPL